MRILVTVGTYKFDDLIKKVDEIALKSNQYFTCQIGEGSYKPDNCSSFVFSDRFHEKVNEVDLIITHAGAGTVYSLLERGKNLIVVPCLNRVDNHQLEITNYVVSKKYCLACKDLSVLEETLYKAKDFFAKSKVQYKKHAFFKSSEIIQYIDI